MTKGPLTYDEVRTKSLVVVDDDGEPRWKLGPSDKDNMPGYRLEGLDADGDTRLSLYFDKDTAQLSCWTGDAEAAIGVDGPRTEHLDGPGPFFTLTNDDGQTRYSARATDQGVNVSTRATPKKRAPKKAAAKNAAPRKKAAPKKAAASKNAAAKKALSRKG